MAQRTRREDRSTKAKRFATLRQRRAQHASHYEALDRRERADASRLHAARQRSIATTGYPKRDPVELRRLEYVELARPVATLSPPRAVLASLAVAFALPLVIAILASFVARQPAAVATRRPHARGQVAATISNGRAHERRRAQPAIVARLQAHPSVAKTQRTVVAAAARRPHVLHSTPVLALAPTIATAASANAPSAVARPLLEKPHVPSRPVSRAAPMQETPQVAIAPIAAPVVHRAPASPWTLSPDGTWVATIHGPSNASGASFDASTGQIIELERSAIDGDAATVTIGWSRPVTVTIISDGATRSVDLPAPDDSAADFAATARTVGPHLVNVGWTPLAQDAGVADYKIYRTPDAGGDPQLVAQLPALKHSWRDLHVAPSSGYSYDVVADTDAGAVEANTQSVNTPEDLPSAPASTLGGKGMFLFYSSLQGDPRFFGRYHPEAVIAEAHKAGIHVIELRMARGSCAMAQTTASRAWLDRLIDAAAQADIKLVAWTVPRRVTTQDLAQTIAAASYRTPSGNGFVGLALDLETGAHYMGDGHKAVAGMVQYIKAVRSATGPHYLIVATVASPEMGNHTNADYPYARIAAYADVLQPMEYWHYFEETSHHEYARGEVVAASAGAVARTRELAGRDIPVDVAGQSVALEGTGAPSGREIQWSLGGAKSAGGIGETFFDWAGTRPDAWAAIQAFDW